MKKWLVSLLVIPTAIVGGIACASGAPSDEDVNRLNENANGGVTTSATPPVKRQITGGDWEVGSKENLGAGVITAGTYIITTPETGIDCYWETVRNFENTLDSVVANGNIAPGETARVVVKSSYAGLSLQGECLAKKKS